MHVCSLALHSSSTLDIAKGSSCSVLHNDALRLSKASPSKDQNGLTPSEAPEHHLKNNILVQNQATKYITPSSPFLYLGVTLTMDLNWKHQHRHMDKNLKQKLDALESSHASPRQTLNIICTAIIPSLAYAFAVTPCSYPDLDKWDAMQWLEGWSKASTTYGEAYWWLPWSVKMSIVLVGCPLHLRGIPQALSSSTRNKPRRPFWTSPICDHASPDPPGRPTQGLCHYIPFHMRRNVTTNKTATQPTYASTSTCLHPCQQAPVSLERKQHVFRRSQKSPPPESPPPNISHPHQLHYQTAYGPRHNWLPWPHISQRKIQSVSGKQLKKNTQVFKKHIIAQNRLATIANLPGTQELSPTSINCTNTPRKESKTVYPT